MIPMNHHRHTEVAIDFVTFRISRWFQILAAWNPKFSHCWTELGLGLTNQAARKFRISRDNHWELFHREILYAKVVCPMCTCWCYITTYDFTCTAVPIWRMIVAASRSVILVFWICSNNSPPAIHSMIRRKHGLFLYWFSNTSKILTTFINLY